MLDNYSNFISQNKSGKASENKNVKQSKETEDKEVLYRKDIVE